MALTLLKHCWILTTWYSVNEGSCTAGRAIQLLVSRCSWCYLWLTSDTYITPLFCYLHLMCSFLYVDALIFHAFLYFNQSFVPALISLIFLAVWFCHFWLVNGGKYFIHKLLHIQLFLATCFIFVNYLWPHDWLYLGLPLTANIYQDYPVMHSRLPFSAWCIYQDRDALKVNVKIKRWDWLM